MRNVSSNALRTVGAVGKSAQGWRCVRGGDCSRTGEKSSAMATLHRMARHGPYIDGGDSHGDWSAERCGLRRRGRDMQAERERRARSGSSGVEVVVRSRRRPILLGPAPHIQSNTAHPVNNTAHPVQQHRTSSPTPHSTSSTASHVQSSTGMALDSIQTGTDEAVGNASKEDLQLQSHAEWPCL